MFRSAGSTGAGDPASFEIARADPALASFYALERHVVTPLGASNHVAAVLVVARVLRLRLRGRGTSAA